MPTFIRSAGSASTAILLAAIGIGLIIGAFTPGFGSVIEGRLDITIFLLIVLLFLPINVESALSAVRNIRFTAIAWVANFLVVAPLGVAIAWLTLNGHPLAMAGLMIYFIAPCTDWFLAFTRLAGGDAALAATLIPINIVTQIALFPVVAYFSTSNTTAFDGSSLVEMLLWWFAVPILVATAIRRGVRLTLGAAQTARVVSVAESVVPFVLGVMIVQIFAGNLDSVVAERALLPLAAVAIVAFFALSFGLSQLAWKAFSLNHAERAALTMTTSARNAPLMLALTVAAIPDQPLVYSIIILGMLLEFPHLTAVSHYLRKCAPGDVESAAETPAETVASASRR
ncbi:hypothetical protein IEU95_01080 [Hoyosella rhizosphaerae]|uniref:Arsenic resistance protein n=1 Tax=Hoyosella rhizosphaerae TaxID=1755582 RepID=A0A916XI89_9ACTN|nr:arsenic resistance protein [Hoyosella rhizosphaerae]MBN4925411.1 hypothetical protein [Hoyosella rhizosphaerae]GGC75391.1 arsenic resistance protein [Hoyosella rhizosphaerae]